MLKFHNRRALFRADAIAADTIKSIKDIFDLGMGSGMGRPQCIIAGFENNNVLISRFFFVSHLSSHRVFSSFLLLKKLSMSRSCFPHLREENASCEFQGIGIIVAVVAFSIQFLSYLSRR